MTSSELQPAKTSQQEVLQERAETEKLIDELWTKLAELGLADSTLIRGSLELATYFHQDDRRSYEPFINHPIRTAINVVKFGITDENVIAAALLHDVIEDHENELEQFFIDTELTILPEGSTTRELANTALELMTNESVLGIVLEVTKSPLEENEERIAAYKSYLGQIAYYASLQALVVKNADFIDNATPPEPDAGLEDPALRLRLDAKQLAAYPILINTVSRLGAIVANEIQASMQNELRKAQQAAQERMKKAA